MLWMSFPKQFWLMKSILVKTWWWICLATKSYSESQSMRRKKLSVRNWLLKKFYLKAYFRPIKGRTLFLFTSFYKSEIHYIWTKLKVRSFNYILLTGLIIILSWIGYILYDINTIENNLIGNIVPLISSLTSFITVLLFYLIFREIKRINLTSLLLGSISLGFVLIMFWDYF